MGILSIHRDWGITPAIVRISTTDSLAIITTPGYILAQQANIELVNSGTFEWDPTDYVLVYYSDNGGSWGFFSYVPSTQSLVPASNQKTVSVTLTAAQVLGMYAAPVLIVAAPATGFAVYPVAAQITTLVSTVFAGGGAAQLQWSNAVHATGTLALDAVTPAAEITAATSQVYTQYGVVTTTANAIATVNGIGLYFSNATGAFTGGAGSTVTVSVSYMLIPV